MKIRSTQVYVDEKFQPLTLVIEEGVIKALETYDQEVDEDYGDYKISPGFVDIHCHGYRGFKYNGTVDEFKRWVKDLPAEGCTSFLPSASTAPKEHIYNYLRITRQGIEEGFEGAEILGNYIEGPFISFSKAGAQDRYNILKPDPKEIEIMQEISGGHILYNTVAPEMDKDHAMIKYCVEHGIKVALGHTDCSYEEAMSALKDGANSFTHTYNGMSQMGHRTPNCVGAALDSEDAYVELISDGNHTHPACARILAKIKGKDRVIIVTDSVSMKGFEPGVYTRDGNVPVEVKEDGSIRLLNGTLAGSGNRMDQVVRKAIEMGIDEVTVFNGATKNPCEFLGIERKGQLKPGKDADIVVLDEGLEVVQTYCKGKKML